MITNRAGFVSPIRSCSTRRATVVSRLTQIDPASRNDSWWPGFLCCVLSAVAPRCLSSILPSHHSLRWSGEHMRASFSIEEAGGRCCVASHCYLLFKCSPWPSLSLPRLTTTHGETKRTLPVSAYLCLLPRHASQNAGGSSCYGGGSYGVCGCKKALLPTHRIFYPAVVCRLLNSYSTV